MKIKTITPKEFVEGIEFETEEEIRQQIVSSIIPSNTTNNILRILSKTRKKGMTIKDLADEVGKSYTGVAFVYKRMERAGILFKRRVKRGKYKTVIKIELTELGKRIAELISEIERTIKGGVSVGKQK